MVAPLWLHRLHNGATLVVLTATELPEEESESGEVLLDHLDQIAGRFRANMADTLRYSFGKRLWSEAAREGVRPDDPGAVEKFMARFNARPQP